MIDTNRLKENIKLLNTHNTKHTPILHLTNGQKHEIELINEIVEDVSLILKKMENKTIVEFPCKVGDTVYIERICGLREDNSPIFGMEQGYVHRLQIDYTRETIWVGATFGVLWCCRPYTDFYYSKEEAEAKLQELNNHD